MTRAVLVCFHKYTPYGDKYYEPIYTYFMHKMNKHVGEFDKLYLLDSNWEIANNHSFAEIIRVNPHTRYYDVYKEVLPQIKEDSVLLMDNDMVVYREGIIRKAFDSVDYISVHDDKDNRVVDPVVAFHVASIYDTIGTYQTNKMNGKNKLCPYFFAVPRNTLMEYRDCEWGPNMPEHETLGKLTEVMLNDGLKPYEFEEDKSNLLFNESGSYEGSSKDLGYYHIRSGSLPAVLLSWRQFDNPQFQKYIKEQPKTEYLRQFAWYWIMGGSIYMDQSLFKDLGVDYASWLIYVEKFRQYHHL